MDAIQKFQNLLYELFQFETSDLDFGIYRILNYKQDQIKKFIEEDLKSKVESAFARYKDERLSNISLRLGEEKEKIVQSLGKEAFTPTGELKEQFKNTPLGKEYLSIKEQKDEVEAIDDIKLQVFNDLYSFFSRFYEEGDFVPQYRYSIKGHKYAIPYDGEEVKLYWANNGQYYTKTGVLFRDYTFKADDYKVIFRVVSAKEELSSNKATKQRFFTLDDENPVEVIPSHITVEEKNKEDNKALIIRFQYRELTEKEVKSYQVEGGSNTSKQEKINQRSYEEILKRIKDIELKVRLSKEYKHEKPLLFYHLSKFSAKNTKDYFIHKDLKKFLSEQLDYFIKAEVLSVETLEKERFLDKHITRARVVREIGEEIIGFLSQIEDFQKRLWEKKKFVLKTEYVITTDRVPEEFYKEIWNNEKQKREWKDLGFDIPKIKEELKTKTLPIDTKYFSVDFKEKLLEKITENDDLDGLLDGLLIKSENWQALNLILEKYKEKVKTVYIDPPYNTGNDDFLYKDKYQHSSWLSMMESRLSLAKKLMNPKGIIFISLGDLNPQEGESYRLQALLKEIFEKRYGNLIWKKRGGIGSFSEKDLTENHEYITVNGRGDSFIYNNILSEKKAKEYKYKDERGDFRWMDLIGPSQQTKERRPNLNYGILYDVSKDKIVGFEYFHKGFKKREFFDKESSGNIFPIWQEGKATWLISRGILEEYYKKGLIGISHENNKYKVKIKNYLYKLDGTINGNVLKSILSDNGVKIGMNIEATKQLRNLFPSLDTDSLNPKPNSLLKFLVYVTCIKKEVVLDFFAGSGTTAHAVMELNKEDGGKRKYILVEMANYFDTVIIPRLKKVCYSFNWKDGEPQSEDGTNQFFKYQILEQYEDTLDNIELRENKQAQLKFGDDYILKYFLDYETRENPSLLNIEHLKNPFKYKLKVNLEEVGEPKEIVVDIPETFNYLLGLKVKKIKVRNNGRKYLFILGEKEEKDIAVIWREYEDKWGDEDFKKDKEIIIREIETWRPHIVYVNGQSVLTPKLGEHRAEIRYIEPEFKTLMR